MKTEQTFDKIVIKDGWGYWDISVFPRGGDFKRVPKFKGNLCIAESFEVVKEILPYNATETIIRLYNGKSYCVPNLALIYIIN